MTIPLTPRVLRHAYELLDATPPFSRWNLPDAEDVVFKVVKDPTIAGWHTMVDGKHTVAVSARCVGFFGSLIEVMAHEMVHVHENHAKACRPGVGHSAAFYKWAGQVCKVHGFDPKSFA